MLLIVQQQLSFRITNIIKYGWLGHRIRSRAPSRIGSIFFV